MAEDNYELPIRKDEMEIVEEYTQKKLLHPDFLPFPTYNMVQSGYPRPDHGVMVPSLWGGTDENGFLIPGSGKYCKVSDVLPLIKKKSAMDTIEGLLNLSDDNIRSRYGGWDKGDCSLIGLIRILLIQEIKKEISVRGDYYDGQYDEFLKTLDETYNT